MTEQRAVIFDMDGTLADCSHRLRFIAKRPKDWSSFLDPERVRKDPPNAAIVELARHLAHGNSLIIVSGRPDSLYQVTSDWLVEHEVQIDRIYMRADGDHRSDTVVKEEILEQIRFDNYAPWLVIDDRKSVVEMWRSNGLTCLQVSDSDF